VKWHADDYTYVKSKSEIEFQYGGRPFSETESSFISAVDWCISSKFGRQIDFHLLKQIPSLNLTRKFISDSMAAIMKNRYDVITPPPIVHLLRNLAGRCKMTCRSKLEIEFQYSGRPFFETGSSFISTVNWDISSKFGRQIDFHLLKQMLSLNLNPEVYFRLYAAILKNRYDVITPPPIFRSLRNLEALTYSRWLHIRQNRNLKWKSNMAAVRFTKPEV